MSQPDLQDGILSRIGDSIMSSKLEEYERKAKDYIHAVAVVFTKLDEIVDELSRREYVDIPIVVKDDDNKPDSKSGGIS